MSSSEARLSVHIISNQHQAVPYRYQHIITASTHTLLITTDAEIHYFLSVSSQHTHIPSRRWSLISIIHLNFVLPLASHSPFLYRYNLFRDTAKTIVSHVNHSLLISISAVWVKKISAHHITCLSVKTFKYVLPVSNCSDKCSISVWRLTFTRAAFPAILNCACVLYVEQIMVRCWYVIERSLFHFCTTHN